MGSLVQLPRLSSLKNVFRFCGRYPSTFAINTLTGQLTTSRSLDRETVPQYQIKVLAKDQGSPSLSATATVFLSLLDVNDNPPVFYPTRYFARADERIVPGTAVARVHAADADLNDKLVYKIEESDGSFYIDENTGTVRAKFVVFNGRRGHRLVVSAIDSEGKKCAENAIVEVATNPKEDEELSFESDNYSFQTDEDDGLRDEYVERELGKVKAVFKRNNSSPENASAARYTIVSGDARHSFDIGERSGVLRTKGKIDRERQATYSLTVVAKFGTTFAEATVNVTVQDLNDNRPQFVVAGDKDEVSVAEDAAVGQQVWHVRAKDSDAGINGRVSYSMAGGDSDQFRVAADTGVVYLNKPLAVAPGTALQAEIKATDGGGLWSKRMIVVTVLDVNDHTPVFEKVAYEMSLPESIDVNERFVAVKAIDEDIGENARLSYNIVSGNEEGKFAVFPDGYVYVKKKLDREQVDYYCLTMKVNDAGRPERTATVPLVVHVLDENDNKPQFANASFTFSVKENEPVDAFVGKVVAVDDDSGRNAELTFSLVGKQNDFIIDPKNGFIRTARVFDREQLVQSGSHSAVVTVDVMVSDNGVTRLHDKVKVNVLVTDVNDNAPTFPKQPYKISLSEGSPVGTQVVRVFASDADEGVNREVSYSIVGGNEEKRFVVDKNSGQISLAKMLDREKTPRYQLTVIAVDGGDTLALNSSTAVTVDVVDENDNAPVFIEADSRIVILENATTNSKLYQFKATDNDSGVNGDIYFAIGSGNRRETFYIDPSSGILYLRKKLDYEEATSYALNVTAYDGGSPRLSTSLLFTVAVQDCNDNAPSFPTTAIVRQIRENIPTNTPIVTVSAEDPDSGLNGKIVYSIVKQEPTSPDADSGFHFQIDANSGVIRTRLLIDRETVDTFRLTIRATDQAPSPSDRLFAEKMVTVIVEDVNDNAPTFVSMNAVVLRETSVRSVVATIVAQDADSGSNGIVTYDLVGGNTELFAIQTSTGSVMLKKQIAEPRTKYQLLIRATDEAVQSDRKSADQLIVVLNPAAKSELIFNDHFGGNVYENEPVGTNILTVSAHLITGGTSSRSSSSRYEIEYYITNVTGSANDRRPERRIFDIDPKTGSVSTAEILDREAGSEWYEIEIYAIVSNSPSSVSGLTTVRNVIT